MLSVCNAGRRAPISALLLCAAPNTLMQLLGIKLAPHAQPAPDKPEHSQYRSQASQLVSLRTNAVSV